MPLETAPFIDGLVITNPTGADAKSTADDHLRVIKIAVKATFPNVTGAVTPTHAQLNFVTGVTSAIQTQIDSKAGLISPAFAGTPSAPTATLGTNSTLLATTAFMQAAIANVNAQTALVVVPVTGITQTAAAGSHYILTNVAATTVTLPATPASGDTVWVTPDNGLATNVINFNGKDHQNVTFATDPTMLLDNAQPTYEFRFVNNKWRLV